jgi:16S rRNA (guanine966-N2)-methyltransferase
VLGDLDGARVLDLYAGTGALGIEALSRGAAFALFVEPSRAALACLRANLASLALETVSEVVGVPAARARKTILARSPYDLILCDPPWADLAPAMRLVAELIASGVMAEGGRLVVEHPEREDPPVPAGFALARVARRTWGDTGVSLFGSEP